MKKNGISLIPERSNAHVAVVFACDFVSLKDKAAMSHLLWKMQAASVSARVYTMGESLFRAMSDGSVGSIIGFTGRSKWRSTQGMIAYALRGFVPDSKKTIRIPLCIDIPSDLYYQAKFSAPQSIVLPSPGTRWERKGPKRDSILPKKDK